MKKILNNIISPLSLHLAKKKEVKEIEAEDKIIISKGSNKLNNIESIVLPHHKPIIKIEL